jgi:hypothetical protein
VVFYLIFAITSPSMGMFVISGSCGEHCSGADLVHVMVPITHALPLRLRLEKNVEMEISPICTRDVLSLNDLVFHRDTNIMTNGCETADNKGRGWRLVFGST